MKNFTENERRHIASLTEIQSCTKLEWQSDDYEIDRPLANISPEEYNDDWEGVQFSARMKGCALRFLEFGAFWKTRGDLPRIYGEFSLVNFHDALQSSDPGESSARNDAERMFLSQLCPIDRTPRSGAGKQTFVRVQPDVTELEIWYSDIADIHEPPHPPGFVRLDIDYCQYLEALLLTKGVYGWQYLFANVTLSGKSLASAAGYLQRMLHVFPSLFPERDYTPLVARLEARL